MKCDDYKKMIFLFSELNEHEKAQLQHHINGCISCQHLFHTIQQQHDMVSSAFRSESPAHHARLTNKIMDAIDTRSVGISIFDKVFASIQNNFVRYSLAVVSLLLVMMFALQTLPVNRNNIAEINTSENKEAKTVHLDSKLLFESIKESADRKKTRQFTGLSMLDCIRECRSGSDEICEGCKSKIPTL